MTKSKPGSLSCRNSATPRGNRRLVLLKAFTPGAARTLLALAKSLAQLQDPARPNFVIFLTDGIPTVGETNEAKLVAAAKAENKVHARIFDFGVGYDVNSRLLDKLARENFGLSDYVRPNEDIERSVAALYSRIASPVMSDVKLKFDLDGMKPEDGAATNRVYPKELVDLFAGEQLVIVGRYKKPGAAKVTISGKVGGRMAPKARSRNLIFPPTWSSTATINRKPSWKNFGRCAGSERFSTRSTWRARTTSS